MIPDRDLGAGGDEALGNRAAKPLRAAGDDGAAAFEIDLVHGGHVLCLPSCAGLTRASILLHRVRRGWIAGSSPAMTVVCGWVHSVQPPSMMWATPVVNALSSLARYTASAPISSAVPSRPIGWRLTNISRPPGPAAAARFSIDGVSMVPGQIALQRMPLVMKSAATARVSAATAALVAP